MKEKDLNLGFVLQGMLRVVSNPELVECNIVSVMILVVLGLSQSHVEVKDLKTEGLDGNDLV